ncbi:MAG: hypothetical protein AAFN27_12210 [Pseudomonadota bacterium]
MCFNSFTILPQVRLAFIVFLASLVLSGAALSQVPEANLIRSEQAPESPISDAMAVRLIDHCTDRVVGSDPASDACARFLEHALDLETQRREAEVAHRIAELEAARAALDHRNRVLIEQEAQTTVFYYMTLVMLAVGVLAAVAHFIKAMRSGDETNVEFAVQKDGVRLKTSMIGFLLLLASMAFYVAYLHAVYGITAVG